MIDLHTHHQRCGHAEGSLADVAGWAIARGIRVLGVSDHAPRFADPDDHPRPHTQMARSEWAGYLAEAAALREELAGRLDLLVGVEADYLPGSEDAYRGALARPELDYVLGSVHEVLHEAGSWNLFEPDSYAAADIDEVARRYWRAVAAAAQSGLFDVLAHLDLIRLLPAPAGFVEEDASQVACAARDGLARIQRQGPAVERPMKRTRHGWLLRRHDPCAA